MDRKVKNKHYDKPSHQRWLYQLADIGLVKAIMIVWGILALVLIATLFVAKALLSGFK